MTNHLVSIVLIGIGATALLDLWMVGRQLVAGVPFANYGLVGRWLGYMPRGRFVHDAIAASCTPRPWAARLQSLLSHAVFGLSLYLAGWLLASV